MKNTFPSFYHFSHRVRVRVNESRVQRFHHHSMIRLINGNTENFVKKPDRHVMRERVRVHWKVGRKIHSENRRLLFDSPFEESIAGHELEIIFKQICIGRKKVYKRKNCAKIHSHQCTLKKARTHTHTCERNTDQRCKKISPTTMENPILWKNYIFYALEACCIFFFLSSRDRELEKVNWVAVVACLRLAEKFTRCGVWGGIEGGEV